MNSTVHTLMPLTMVVRKLLLSSCVIICAVLASAEGDAKLALTAMLSLQNFWRRTLSKGSANVAKADSVEQPR